MAEEPTDKANEAQELDLNSVEEMRENIISVIKTIYDPEIPVNIYELGLIYEVQVLPLGMVSILMTLTSPNCPAAQSLPAEIEVKVKSIPGIKDVDLEITFDPPWSQEMMSEEAQLELGFL